MSKTQTVVCSTTGPGDPQYQLQNVYPSIVIPAGSFAIVPVQAPAEGRLVAMHANQTGGANVAAVMEVMFSRKPYGNAIPKKGTYWTDRPQTPLISGFVTGSPPNLYRVVGPQAIGSGTAMDVYSTNNNGFTYNNVDGDANAPERFVYVVLIPTGSGAPTTWDFTICIESALGNG